MRNLKRRSPPTRTARGSRYCVLEVDSVPRTVPSTSDRPRRRITFGTRRPTWESICIPVFAVNQRTFGHDHPPLRAFSDAPRSRFAALTHWLNTRRAGCPATAHRSFSRTTALGSDSRTRLPATATSVETVRLSRTELTAAALPDQRQARPPARPSAHPPCRPAPRVLSRSRTGARQAHQPDVALPRSSRSCDTVGRCATRRRVDAADAGPHPIDLPTSRCAR